MHRAQVAAVLTTLRERFGEAWDRFTPDVRQDLAFSQLVRDAIFLGRTPTSAEFLRQAWMALGERSGLECVDCGRRLGKSRVWSPATNNSRCPACFAKLELDGG